MILYILKLEAKGADVQYIFLYLFNKTIDDLLLSATSRLPEWNVLARYALALDAS